ncbi:MAG: ADP-ribosylglycohydrolase family protein [Bryobacteraceae bacterium]
MTRRAIFQSGMIAAANAGAQAQDAPVPLREKFFGCIAGCHIGSSMGATVEGWPWERIEKEHGTLAKLLPYEHYRNGWKRPPGTTEDGVERQKLIITAILDKQDRVTAEDVRAVWLRDIKPISIGMVSEPFEAQLLAISKTHIPASDIGKYCDYSGLITLARSCHPVPLINAGDIAGAIQDVREVGQLYHVAGSRAIRWAEVTAVAIAAGTRPRATVDSVTGAIFDNCDKAAGPHAKPLGILKELERALRTAGSCSSFRELRVKFDEFYGSKGIPYANSFANEVVSKALAIFRMTRGVTRDAVIAAVNMGRDTDCCASVAGGISGALTGGASLDREWIEQVDSAVKQNIYTNSQRTLRETSDALYNAYRARLARMKAFAAEMEVV